MAATPDGNYIVVAHSTSPFFSVYERSGNTWTKLANPASLPSSTGRICCISNDGVYIGVQADTSNFYMYKRTGTTLTRLTSNVPTGAKTAMRFSADGNYLMLGSGSSFELWSRSGDSFTQQTITYSGTTPPTAPNNIAWVTA